jgi:hypothetical protein
MQDPPVRRTVRPCLFFPPQANILFFPEMASSPKAPSLNLPEVQAATSSVDLQICTANVCAPYQIQRKLCSRLTRAARIRGCVATAYRDIDPRRSGPRLPGLYIRRTKGISRLPVRLGLRQCALGLPFFVRSSRREAVS